MPVGVSRKEQQGQQPLKAASACWQGKSGRQAGIADRLGISERGSYPASCCRRAKLLETWPQGVYVHVELLVVTRGGHRKGIGLWQQL